MKTAVHFGAGKIGRGFIGDLLHQSGYRIVFADVNEALNKEMNTYHNYFLYVIEEEHRRVEIDNVSAYSPVTEKEQLIGEIVQADLITTAVIVDNFAKIAGVLAEGLKARLDAGKPRIDVIPCENAPYCGDMLVKELAKTGVLTEEEIGQAAAVPNTVVDRMVFGYTCDGREGIEIGKDFELAIEQTRLADTSSEPIKGAEYTDNIEKYLERKLFVINGGHCSAGYLAHLKGFTIIQDYFRTEEGLETSRKSMAQAAALIEKKHGFDHDKMMAYVDFALNRWCTPGVADEITRISRAPIRKLKPAERMVAPAVQCAEAGLPNDLLIKAIGAAFLFDVDTDDQAVELVNYVKEKGIEDAVENYTGLKKGTELHDQVVAAYNELKQNR